MVFPVLECMVYLLLITLLLIMFRGLVIVIVNNTVTFIMFRGLVIVIVN